MHREVVPADLPPPIVPVTLEPEPTAATVVDDALQVTGRMEPVESERPSEPEPEPEPELDPRELKALSRQERKEAKAALRREQQEARNAARQAKAAAKAAAKLGAAAPSVSAAPETAADVAENEPVLEEVSEKVDEPTALIEPIEPDQQDEVAADETDPAPVATDPRSRAAQRVQRRLGKDAEKLSAAEARARAREEARRRRAQAKEQRSGVVAEEAVRPPEQPTEGNLTEDVSVVEAGDTSRWDDGSDQRGMTAPTIAEPIDDDLAVEEPTAEDQAVEEVVADELAVADVVEEPESDLPKPVIEQRIDEPAPVDEPEAVEVVEDEDLGPVEEDVADEPEPAAAWTSRIRSREVATPADGDDATASRFALAPIAGVVGLVALGISVLLAVGALLVALGLDSGGLYEGLKTVANLLVGPLEGAFDFSGANAERKEHFLAWGAGSIGYLLISFAGQAMQRANEE